LPKIKISDLEFSKNPQIFILIKVIFSKFSRGLGRGFEPSRGHLFLLFFIFFIFFNIEKLKN
jgi:hypothetical protein